MYDKPCKNCNKYKYMNENRPIKKECHEKGVNIVLQYAYLSLIKGSDAEEMTQGNQQDTNIFFQPPKNKTRYFCYKHTLLPNSAQCKG